MSLLSTSLFDSVSGSKLFELWSELLVYSSILGACAQFIAYMSGYDLWGKYIQYRDSRWYFISIDSRTHARVYEQLMSFFSSYPELTNKMNRATIGEGGVFKSQQHHPLFSSAAQSAATQSVLGEKQTFE